MSPTDSLYSAIVTYIYDLRKIVYTQPTASDSSDQLFFIRNLRCQVRIFEIFLSAATRRQALRAMHACSRSSRSGEKMGSNRVRTPILGTFWAIWGFLALGKGHASTQCHSTLAVVQDSICAVVCLPLAAPSRHTHRRETSYQTNIRQAIAGFWRLGYCRD